MQETFFLMATCMQPSGAFVRKIGSDFVCSRAQADVMLQRAKFTAWPDGIVEHPEIWLYRRVPTAHGMKNLKCDWIAVHHERSDAQ